MQDETRTAARPAPTGFQSDEEAILTVLGDAEPDPDWFTPAFIAQVPPEQIRRITLETRATIGPVTAIEPTEDGFTVQTDTHDLPVVISRDAAGRIAGLLLRPPRPKITRIEDAIAAVTALPGRTACLIARNGETIAAHNATTPLAVGSAFKLGVLKGLKAMIAANEASWEQVVALKKDQISLASGALQVLPPGAPVTVYTLAALMIAISDNTATDTLIDLVGRDYVAALLDTDTVLKTRELFVFKSDEALRARYRAAGPGERSGILAEIADRDLPSIGQITGQHIEGFEYYLPLTRLCTLIEGLGDEPILGLNPGPLDKKDWRRIAYKGGSEQGVLNMTSRVLDAAGNSWCIAMTWNDDKALDEMKGLSAYSGLAAAVRHRAATENE